MSPIPTRLSGQAGSILIVEMPAHVVAETCDLVRDEVAARLPNADGAGLVLDCRAVVMLNSLGITGLLEIQDLCRRRSAPLILAGVPKRVSDMLALLRLNSRFRTEPDPDAAVASLDAPGPAGGGAPPGGGATPGPRA